MMAAGFTVTKTTLYTDEDGKKDKFTLLILDPLLEVVFNILRTDPSEISVSHSGDVIKFNKDNWDGPSKSYRYRQRQTEFPMAI